MGKFLVFEGIDGCGKSTCVDILKKHIESCGLSAKLHHEPNFIRNTIVSVLNEHKDNKMLPEAAAMLFTADRLLNQERLRQWLSKYDYVIYDRYYMSTLAYQGAMGADIRFLHRLQEYAIRPNHTIFVDISPQEAKMRREARGLPEEPLEKQDIQQKVYDQFKSLILTKKRLLVLKNEKLEDTERKLKEMFDNFLK